MLITVNDIEAKNIEIRSKFDGSVVQRVQSFDTESKEAEIIATYEIVEKEVPTTKEHFGRAEFRTNKIAQTGYILKKFKDDPNAFLSNVTFKCRLGGFGAFDKNTGEEIN
jgi:hypothetical protein